MCYDIFVSHSDKSGNLELIIKKPLFEVSSFPPSQFRVLCVKPQDEAPDLILALIQIQDQIQVIRQPAELELCSIRKHDEKYIHE